MPPDPPPPPATTSVYPKVDWSAADALTQHRNTETMLKRFFAEIHSETVGNKAMGDHKSMDNDYRAERLNPGHGFAGNIPRDKLDALEALAKQLGEWMATQLNKVPQGAITWSTLKNSPDQAALVAEVRQGLTDILSEQQAMCGAGVKYLTAAQRARCCVEIDQQLLNLREFDDAGRFIGLKPFNTNSGGSGFSGQGRRAIWVQGPSGRFYTSTDFQVGRFHHSSFLSGRDVKAAGDWQVNDGFIEYISAMSGHYKPPLDALQNAMRDLETAGATINWRIKVDVYKKGTNQPVKIHAEQFLDLDAAALADLQPFPFST